MPEIKYEMTSAIFILLCEPGGLVVDPHHSPLSLNSSSVCCSSLAQSSHSNYFKMNTRRIINDASVLKQVMLCAKRFGGRCGVYPKYVVSQANLVLVDRPFMEKYYDLTQQQSFFINLIKVDDGVMRSNVDNTTGNTWLPFTQ
jgi:hypothetical protein